MLRLPQALARAHTHTHSLSLSKPVKAPGNHTYRLLQQRETAFFQGLCVSYISRSR